MSLDGMKDKSRQLITSRVTYKQALERTTFETSNEVTRSTSFNGMKDLLFSFCLLEPMCLCIQSQLTFLFLLRLFTLEQP